MTCQLGHGARFRDPRFENSSFELCVRTDRIGQPRHGQKLFFEQVDETADSTGLLFTRWPDK